MLYLWGQVDFSFPPSRSPIDQTRLKNVFWLRGGVGGEGTDWGNTVIKFWDFHIKNSTNIVFSTFIKATLFFNMIWCNCLNWKNCLVKALLPPQNKKKCIENYNFYSRKLSWDSCYLSTSYFTAKDFVLLF